MQVYILDTNYHIIGMIDDAESVLWDKRYNDLGECEIYIPCNVEYLAMLRRGHYVYRYDDDMFCKIERVEIETDVENGDHIIATAPDIFKILSGRIVRWQIVYSGAVGAFIKKVLIDNVISPAQTHRKITRFKFDDSNIGEFTEQIDVSAFTDDLADLITTTCKRYSIGFRLSYDMEADELVFRLYRGVNRATGENGYVEFSPTFGNILNSKYSEDDADYKNVVYAGYKSADKDDDTIYLLSYPTNDYGIKEEERREMYVDATGISRDVTREELDAMFGDDLQKVTTTITDGEGKSVYNSAYTATLSGERVNVATSLQDVVEAGAEAAEEKITWTDYAYTTLLVRGAAATALSEQTRKKVFEGAADTKTSYQYKTDFDLGDIVKVKDAYGNEADARVVEIMESDDADNGYVAEPKFENLN